MWTTLKMAGSQWSYRRKVQQDALGKVKRVKEMRKGRFKDWPRTAFCEEESLLHKRNATICRDWKSTFCCWSIHHYKNFTVDWIIGAWMFFASRQLRLFPAISLSYCLEGNIQNEILWKKNTALRNSEWQSSIFFIKQSISLYFHFMFNFVKHGQSYFF